MRGAAGWILVLCATVVAEEKPLPKPFAQAKADYERAAKGNDPKALTRALTELARSGLLSDDKREKLYIKAALKRSLKHRALEVRLAAAQGYGVLRLPGSSRDLRPYLVKARPLAFALAVVEAWGEITDPGSHADLLALIKKPVDDADRRALAQAAARALRKYRALPRVRRVEVVDKLMQTYDVLFALAHRRAREGSPGVKWWEAVDRELAGAFNVLTGQNLEDYYECYEWWQENRRTFKSRK
ncbi:MAG: hypothetical protein ACYTEZ_15660 [Planctomycetota bacterium]|jgi:hypothetical protein